MSKIKKLKNNIINNIAAGEIIESPFSVVKELIENSIDAKSTKIDVILSESGLKSIIVKDNGKGMTDIDMKLAFKRHTTSKIYSKDDLFNIKTLGFRGEALPSISSVSMLTASSLYRNSKYAYELKIDGGEFKSINKSSLDNGTLIKVSNMFYNLPARKKFLKKEATELNKITDIVKSYALCYPDIEFNYLNNGRAIYSLQISDLKKRIINIFGSQYRDSLIPVCYKKDNFEINGFSGNIDLIRKRKANQFIFLNQRLIKDKMVSDSIRKPFLSAIERNEYPFYVLNITVPFDSVDVNVHPNKNEVRFKNEKYISQVIKDGITDSIKNDIKVTSTFFGQFDKFKEEKSTVLDFRDDLVKEIPDDIQKHFVNYEKFDNREEELVESSNDKVLDTLFNDGQDPLYYDVVDVWQIHNKYLLTEISSGLLIIDQHVAHERVIYEKVKKAFDSSPLPSQSTLFPKTIKFDEEDYSKFLDIVPFSEKIGYKMREFGNNSIIIEGVPSDIKWGNEEDIINDVLDRYIEYEKISSSYLDYLAATYSCKAAVKAGDYLELEERRQLIDNLFATENPYYCPHGRPIVISIKTDELDKRFERK